MKRTAELAPNLARAAYKLYAEGREAAEARTGEDAVIIGISGKAGSGKSAVADRLVAKHGFVSVSFADPMKRFCAEVFDWDEEVWGPSECRSRPDGRYLHRARGALGTTMNGNGDRVPCPAHDEYLSARYALQTLGTQWGRDCYRNVWIDYALRVAKRLEAGDCYYDAKHGIRSASYLMSAESLIRAKPHVVIPDIRFPNEVAAIRAVGGGRNVAGPYLWRIKRPGADDAVGIAGHASETALDGFDDSEFDMTILNTGTLDELLALVDRSVP